MADFADRTPFYPTKTDEEKDKGNLVTLRLNKSQLKQLKEDMIVLNQVKPSTAIKQLWAVGSNVLHGTETGKILNTILGNQRRNARLGITEPGPEIAANVKQL